MKFVLTSEHLAQERAKLDAREKELKAERAQLDEFEREAARLASIYEPIAPDVSEVRGPAKSTKRRKAPVAPRASASERNRIYTLEQIEILSTASRADLAQLAKDWGRTTDGLEKKREEIRAIAAAAAAEEPATEEPVPEAALEVSISEPSHPAPYEDHSIASPPLESDVRNRGWVMRPEQMHEPESADVFENTSGHEWNSRSSRSSLRPGKPVSGLIDNGPGNQRVLDPVSFSSKNTG